jgi:hypothetical protein
METVHDVVATGGSVDSLGAGEATPNESLIIWFNLSWYTCISGGEWILRKVVQECKRWMGIVANFREHALYIIIVNQVLRNTERVIKCRIFQYL